MYLGVSNFLIMAINYNENEYTQYQKTYLDHVEGDVMELLAEQKDSFSEFIESLSDEDLNFSYAENKWTMRQLLMHIIDTEAIFTYRALAISRAEKQTLPGFDQDDYVSNTDFDHLDKEYLINYFTITRYNTLIVFKGMSDEQMMRIGKISDYSMSVRVAAAIIAGHLEYHKKLIKERYKLDV